MVWQPLVILATTLPSLPRSKHLKTSGGSAILLGRSFVSAIDKGKTWENFLVTVYQRLARRNIHDVGHANSDHLSKTCCHHANWYKHQRQPWHSNKHSWLHLHILEKGQNWYWARPSTRWWKMPRLISATTESLNNDTSKYCPTLRAHTIYIKKNVKLGIMMNLIYTYYILIIINKINILQYISSKCVFA